MKTNIELKKSKGSDGRLLYEVMSETRHFGAMEFLKIRGKWLFFSNGNEEFTENQLVEISSLLGRLNKEAK